MNYWNQKQKRTSGSGDKKRTNWNQSLKTASKSTKPKRIKKTLQYLLLLKKFNNIVDYKNIKLLKAFLTKYLQLYIKYLLKSISLLKIQLLGCR